MTDNIPQNNKLNNNIIKKRNEGFFIDLKGYESFNFLTFNNALNYLKDKRDYKENVKYTNILDKLPFGIYLFENKKFKLIELSKGEKLGVMLLKSTYNQKTLKPYIHNLIDYGAKNYLIYKIGNQGIFIEIYEAREVLK